MNKKLANEMKAVYHAAMRFWHQWRWYRLERRSNLHYAKAMRHHARQIIAEGQRA